MPLLPPPKRCPQWSFLAVLLIGFLYSSSSLAAAQTPASSKNVILAGCEHDYPPFCITETGKAEGFSVELLNAVLKAMGKEAAYSLGPWSEVKRALEAGSIQVLPLVGRTPEREQVFDFTFPYLTLHGTIVVREDNEDIKGLKDLRGRQVVVMKGDNAEEFMKRSDLGARLVTTRNFSDALNELSAGKHDAVVVQRLLCLRLLKDNGITNLRFTGPPLSQFKQSFCFAVREGDEKLLSLLNEGLSIVIADGTLTRLMSKWLGALEQEQHRTIVVGGDSSYPPYEYLDEDGNPAGHNVELTRAIAGRIGLKVRVELGPWSEIRKKLESGQIDMIHGMFYSKERGRDFTFSHPHTIVDHVAVTRLDEKPATDVKGLKGKRIVLERGDIMHDFAVNNGLEDQLTLVVSQEEALRQLAQGQHDTALVARVPALYRINQHHWSNLKVSDSSFVSRRLCYAARHDNRILVAAFREGLTSLQRDGSYQKIYNRWFDTYSHETTSFRKVVSYTLRVIFPAAIIAGVVLLWNLSLRRQVHKQTTLLRENEERLSLALEGSQDAPWDRNLITNKPYYSPQWWRQLGYEPGEITQTNEIWYSFLHPDDQARVSQHYKKCVKEGPDRYKVEFRLRHKDGHYITVLSRGGIVRDDSGKAVRVSGVNTDITEKRELEDRLRQTEKLEAIGHLAGGIAHDFNNQLAGVLGYADMLVNRLEDPKLKRYAENIKRSADRSAKLTKQLLAFGRKGKNLLELIDLHQIISEVCSVLERSIDKRIHISQHLEAQPATILGDPSQIHSALLNLCINARDAMPEGGMLTFSTKNLTLDQASITSHGYTLAPGRYVCVTLSDTGIGMDEATKQRIFEPFFTTKEEGKGTGLGLASVYGTIKNHDGYISVYTEKGKGSSFHFMLPLHNKEGGDVPIRDLPPVRGKGFLMVVDDEESVRNLVIDILSELGYTAEGFEDGEAALAYYKDHWQSVDLVILDMVMPKRNGRDTFLAMREINPEIRAILSSGYSLNGDAQEILDRGVKAFVGKPYDQSELSQAVAGVLKGKKG